MTYFLISSWIYLIFPNIMFLPPAPRFSPAEVWCADFLQGKMRDGFFPPLHFPKYATLKKEERDNTGFMVGH